MNNNLTNEKDAESLLTISRTTKYPNRNKFRAYLMITFAIVMLILGIWTTVIAKKINFITNDLFELTVANDNDSDFQGNGLKDTEIRIYGTNNPTLISINSLKNKAMTDIKMHIKVT